MTKVIYLTGGIATGKSTAAAMLRRMRVPVFDADEAVHWLLENDATLQRTVAEHFPSARSGSAINRKALAVAVFADAKKLKLLEALLHPRVRRMQRQFLHKHARARLVVLDIPLLFETGWHWHLKHPVWLTHCTAHVQRTRALARPQMTPERLKQIQKRQWPQAKKLAHAARVLHSGLGRATMWRDMMRALCHARA